MFDTLIKIIQLGALAIFLSLIVYKIKSKKPLTFFDIKLIFSVFVMMILPIFTIW